ncbi:MAG TPA: hypothetical protein VJ842_12610 [Pyrinomonadaceae bacterium]|nr:hypothetical protein [Pyrinomonadaceae bacterium]
MKGADDEKIIQFGGDPVGVGSISWNFGCTGQKDQVETQRGTRGGDQEVQRGLQDGAKGCQDVEGEGTERGRGSGENSAQAVYRCRADVEARAKQFTRKETLCRRSDKRC